MYELLYDNSGVPSITTIMCVIIDASTQEKYALIFIAPTGYYVHGWECLGCYELTYDIPKVEVSCLACLRIRSSQCIDILCMVWKDKLALIEILGLK